MRSNRHEFHTVLKDITRRYGSAMQRFEQAMSQGRQKDADRAIGDMQEIEQSVTIIERPAR